MEGGGTYGIGAPRTPRVCGALDGHIAELCEEAAQLVWDESEDTSRRQGVGCFATVLRGRRWCVDTAHTLLAGDPS